MKHQNIFLEIANIFCQRQKSPSFVRDEQSIYTHSHNLSGRLLHPYGVEYDFEFDIKINDDTFYPLKNDYINFSLYPSNDIPWSKHFSEYPLTTRVGWRGESMLWENLHYQPNVVYEFKEPS